MYIMGPLYGTFCSSVDPVVAKNRPLIRAGFLNLGHHGNVRHQEYEHKKRRLLILSNTFIL